MNRNELFNNNSIRFIIFNEDSTGTRSVLFDNINFNYKKTPTSPNSTSPPTSPSLLNSIPTSPKHPLSPSSSTNLALINRLNNSKFKPMVYGTMPMIVSNPNSIKVHSMR